MEFERNGMYRVRAVADALDVHPATIYRAVESGALDAIRVGTGKGALRIPGWAISTYLSACADAAYEAYVVGGESAELADDQATEGERAGEVV